MVTSKWDYQPHQVELGAQGYPILKKYGMLYLAMEERTGKTGVALNIAELSKATEVLIITKKKPLKGWQEHLDNLPLTKKYTLTNYESVHKLPNKKYKLVILDEASANLSAFPRLGTRAETIKELVYDSYVIFMSATPSAQSTCQLFNQFAMTKYSPFNKYPDFYSWHSGATMWKNRVTGNIRRHRLDYTTDTQDLVEVLPAYGIPDTIRIGNRQQETYKLAKDFKSEIEHLFISKTRRELGFEHEPVDKLHYVDLDAEVKSTISTLKKDKLIRLPDNLVYVADSPIKMSMGLYQLEGSTIKLEDESIQLPELNKVKYIKNTWGDTKDIAIFYHFVEEGKMLAKHFKNAQLYQSTSYAMGVDLSHIPTIIIYSMSFSVADYTQRRNRQANMFRKDPIIVNYLLVKNSISDHVYNTVCQGKKFNVDTYYKTVINKG